MNIVQKSESKIGNKNELSVFQKNKNFETMVIFSTVLCFFIWLASLPELAVGVVVAMIWPLSFLFYFIHRTIGYQKYLKRNKYIECTFAASFDDLASSLQKVGVELKNKIGNQYIFQTCNYVFLNSRVVARDDEKYCTLLLTKYSYDYLKGFLNLKLSDEEFNRDN